MTVDYLLRYLRPFYPGWDDELAAQLVRQFKLPGDRKLKHLSRGMRMKAALASSLAYRPEVVVLDEPFTGLDPLARDEFIGGLLERSQNTTVFISSHDLADIETFASHIAYLEDGRIQFSEELSSLSDRFREIEITFDAAPRCPAIGPYPGSARIFGRRHSLYGEPLRRRAHCRRNSPALPRRPRHLRHAHVAALHLRSGG